MDTQILEELGLTKGEIKVYLSLLELGPSTAGPILEKADIQNSVLHFNINRLIEKGLVTYVKKGKVKIYQAADPEALLDYVEDKKKDLQKILPEIKQKQKLAKEKEVAEIFEGKKGIMTMLVMQIEDAKPGDDFIFFGSDIGDKDKQEEIVEFYKQIVPKRKAKKLVIRGIIRRRWKELYEHINQDMRYIDFPTPTNMAVCNNKVILVAWTEKPRGIMITSKHIAEKETAFFEEIWKMAKR